MEFVLSSMAYLVVVVAPTALVSRAPYCMDCIAFWHVAMRTLDALELQSKDYCHCNELEYHWTMEVVAVFVDVDRRFVPNWMLMLPVVYYHNQTNWQIFV